MSDQCSHSERGLIVARDDSASSTDVPQHSSAMQQQHQTADKAEDAEQQQQQHHHHHTAAADAIPWKDSSAAADSVGGTDGAVGCQQLAAGADVTASSAAITSVATETAVLSTETSVSVTAEGRTRLTVVATAKPARTAPVESSDGAGHGGQQKRSHEESKEEWGDYDRPKRPRLP